MLSIVYPLPEDAMAELQTAFDWSREPERGAAVAPRDDGAVTVPTRAEARAAPEPALPPDTELWHVDHAARFLKMSTSWIYKRVEAGVLPCVRVDGWSLRFVPADLRAWAATQPAKRRARRAATTRR
jgi:predicted DNA-binding transcriptional regulator AlpA